MNTLNFYKQALTVVLLSGLLVGCSSKSTSDTSVNGDSNTTTQQDGNGTDDTTTGQIVEITGGDQNVTIGDTITLEANVTGVTGDIDYQWNENGADVEDGAAYVKTYNTNGEFNTTVNVTYNTDKTASDSVLIRVGKYVNKEIIRDCNGNLLIVKIHETDDTDNLLTITEYRDLNGNLNPENDSANTPYATATYSPDGSKTTTFSNGNEESYSDNRDETGTGTIVSVDSIGTTRTFTYENYKLISGKAEYQDGTIKDYVYNYENDKLVSETVWTTDSNGNITTETITFNDVDNTTTVETGETCENTSVIVQTFLWNY